MQCVWTLQCIFFFSKVQLQLATYFIFSVLDYSTEKRWGWEFIGIITVLCNHLVHTPQVLKKDLLQIHRKSQLQDSKCHRELHNLQVSRTFVVRVPSPFSSVGFRGQNALAFFGPNPLFPGLWVPEPLGWHWGTWWQLLLPRARRGVWVTRRSHLTHSLSLSPSQNVTAYFSYKSVILWRGCQNH